MRNKSVGVGVANTNSIVKDVTKFIILVIMMSENRFTINLEDECIDDAEERIFISFLDRIDFYELCAFLNEQEQKIQRWKNLYELKDSEVTARVDTLNRVCNYYLTETRFKGDTDPNDAVKEVINEILNAPIYEE